MNYIKLINTFWDVSYQDDEGFDMYEVVLYFTLLDMANRRNWKPISIYREDILLRTGMAKNTYYRARKTLADAGLIQVEEGSNAKVKSKFTIVECLSTETVGKTLGKTVEETQGKTVGKTILNKPLNYNKPINKECDPLEKYLADVSKTPEEIKEKTCAKKESLDILKQSRPDADFSAEFLRAWNELFSQPQFAAKTSYQIQRIAMDLQEYDEDWAIGLINYAIDGKYNKVTYPNTKTDYLNHKKKNELKFNSDTPATRKQELDELLTETRRILSQASS